MSNIKLSPEAICQEMNGEMVILDIASETYFSLNEVGTELWQQLASNPDLAEAVRCLHDLYSVDLDTLQKDVALIIDQMAAAGLVVIEPNRQHSAL